MALIYQMPNLQQIRLHARKRDMETLIPYTLHLRIGGNGYNRNSSFTAFFRQKIQFESAVVYHVIFDLKQYAQQRNTREKWNTAWKYAALRYMPTSRRVSPSPVPYYATLENTNRIFLVTKKCKSIFTRLPSRFNLNYHTIFSAIRNLEL